MAVTPAGQYYLVASDGGIFSFPTADGPPLYGSTGSITLNKPVSAMTMTAGGRATTSGPPTAGSSAPDGPTRQPFYGSAAASR